MATETTNYKLKILGEAELVSRAAINDNTNLIDSALAGKIDTAQKGVANGLAPLGSNSKIPADYLPSFVDDVVDCDSFAALPTTGETGKIYITIDTTPPKQYRWSGSAYAELVSFPGTTDAVVEGTTNHYFTASRVLGVVLEGLTFASNVAVTAADSLLIGIGKLQAQITALATALSGKEASLGNPDTDGKMLVSTAAGVRSWLTVPSGGSGGVTIHNDLTNRDAVDAHPLAAITGLATAISNKETSLGNPDTDGKMLVSSAAGVRSWQAVPSSGSSNLTWTEKFILYNPAAGYVSPVSPLTRNGAMQALCFYPDVAPASATVVNLYHGTGNSISAALTSAATTITVANAITLSVATYMLIDKEVVLVVALNGTYMAPDRAAATGTTLLVNRATQGTTAAAHDAGTLVLLQVATASLSTKLPVVVTSLGASVATATGRDWLAYNVATAGLAAVQVTAVQEWRDR